MICAAHLGRDAWRTDGGAGDDDDNDYDDDYVDNDNVYDDDDRNGNDDNDAGREVPGSVRQGDLPAGLDPGEHQGHSSYAGNQLNSDLYIEKEREKEES